MDNIASSIGRILKNYESTTDLYLEKWLSLLPIEIDKEEAVVCHKNLLILLEKKLDVLMTDD